MSKNGQNENSDFIPGYYGAGATQVATRIIEAFESGQVAAPLATTWLDFADKPMNHWSRNNRFLAVLQGCSDARGYRQWQKVGRQVRKGEKAGAYVLRPKLKTVEDEETGEKTRRCIGFVGQAVFDVSQTDGDPLEQPDYTDFLDSLPLAEVAEAWGIKLTTEDTAVRGALGYYRYSGAEKIALGVQNLSTWLHELVHAADNRNGNLGDSSAAGRAATEAVAELGGAVLAHLTGHPEEADEGGCWSYIKRQANRAETHPIKLARQVLDRTITAIDLILEAAGATVGDSDPWKEEKAEEQEPAAEPVPA